MNVISLFDNKVEHINNAMNTPKSAADRVICLVPVIFFLHNYHFSLILMAFMSTSRS